MSKRGLGIAVALGLLLPVVPRVASAQEWLKDRRYSEGVGIKTGDLELHPGIAGEIGYDSNWFLRTDKTGPNISNGSPQAPITGAGVLRITPSLTLTTIGTQRREGEGGGEPPKVKLRAGLSATYREFFGDNDISKQRNISGAADIRADFLPERPWGGALFANYQRTIQPNTVTGDPNLSFNRDDIGIGGEVIAQPGGGTLDWRFGYQFHDTLFEDTAGTPFNNITHEGFTRGRWKFRPRTALLYDATFRFISYQNLQTAVPGGLHNSTPVRARLGLNGLITPRVALLVLAGYGASFYNTRGNVAIQQYDSVIGQAEAKFFLSANPSGDAPNAVSLTLSSISLGYTRDFQNSYLGDYYGSDRGYAKIVYFFAGRALASLEGGVGAIEYPNIFFPSGNLRANAFTDIRADATLFGEYRFTDSLGLNATLRYTANFSNTQLQLVEGAGPGAGQVYDMNWKRFEAFLGVRWFL